MHQSLLATSGIAHTMVLVFDVANKIYVNLLSIRCDGVYRTKSLEVIFPGKFDEIEQGDPEARYPKI